MDEVWPSGLTQTEAPRIGCAARRRLSDRDGLCLSRWICRCNVSDIRLAPAGHSCARKFLHRLKADRGEQKTGDGWADI
jgi:hypothetical protein